ncbi:class I SAM-dependent methyltransferase [Streptomyces olivaceus]|uniref:class I SAM-dependent methyltransferase n=1 Tax=Streptomyces olivaceus TaxID=47716 RepID=UPI001CC9BA1A|nr:class I SAM-dependent methyltransferase [Streptomyces olivaceus]MBZ6230291.1 class I SAM-dependent methyltransferase [Streptomyces olivaceus]
MTEEGFHVPENDCNPRHPDNSAGLSLAQLKEHFTLGPLDRLPTSYRGPRKVTGDGWVGFATRLERGEELSLIRSLTASNLRVLDVGGGSGEMARAIAAQNGQCTAIEPHTQLVETIREGAATGVLNVVAGTAEDLPFSDSSFDAVYCAWVLPYVKDIRQAVTEMIRVCDSSKPESKIVLIAGGCGNELLTLLNDVCVPVADEPYDHHGYLLATAAQVLAEHGFTDFSLQHAESSIRFDETRTPERAATAATVLTEFWYGPHAKAEEIRNALEPALARHFAVRPHAIGDQAAVLVARPAS